MSLEPTDRIENKLDEFFHRLSTRARMRLPRAGTLDKYVDRLRRAHSTEDAREIRKAARDLLGRLASVYRVAPPKVAVRGRRPHIRGSMIHGIAIVGLNEGRIIEQIDGLYRRRRRSITVWIKTAAKGQTVAFRTLLLTLVHEFLHHLDHERLIGLASPHTKAFYERGHRLYHRLLRERTRPGHWRDNLFDGTSYWVPDPVNQKLKKKKSK